jgi:hypothetical protein
MNQLDDKQFKELIKAAIGPMGEQGPARDLWPAMLRKLDEPRIRFSWFDWVLAALAVLLCILVPEALPGLLYHL